MIHSEMTYTWMAPGYEDGLSHDYDAAWDYLIAEQMPASLAQTLDKTWKTMRGLNDADAVIIPFAVALVEPASLPNQSVAVYCMGTSGAPVIVLDESVIVDHCGPNNALYEQEIFITLLHELRHAWQETEELLTGMEDDQQRLENEEDAESWARKICSAIF